ncbi:MAG: iron-sulfur cluster assembly scaffold protein [Candidatus Levybacteria bacterium]|nr:iron-sulfur cluster assembly scaffold protein [Candidatus Levybacteria bacterium]
MDNLYREEILEHYQNPQNFGKLKSFDVSSKQTNPFCGDEIEIFVKLASQGQTLQKIGFIGKGCAICIAAASILTEFAKGKTKKQLTKFTEKDMLSLLGIQVSETRKKCALLGLAVLKGCISNF